MSENIEITAPVEPAKDPAEHESPKAYAENWWRYHRTLFRMAWAELAGSAVGIATGEAYPGTISGYGSTMRKIEYHGALAQHFVNVHSHFEDPRTDTDGWAVYSISLGRELFTASHGRSTDSIRNWAEDVKREATLDFIQQTLPLLDRTYLLGDR